MDTYMDSQINRQKDDRQIDGKIDKDCRQMN